jgi:hypothetical protein
MDSTRGQWSAYCSVHADGVAMKKVAPTVASSNLRANAPAAPRLDRRSSAAKGKTPRARKSLVMQDRILDAAEELFAQHGLYGVTIRDVAGRAKVDTALLHYYFGTKNGLFDAVLLRRAEVLNKARGEALQRCEAQRVRGEYRKLEFQNSVF